MRHKPGKSPGEIGEEQIRILSDAAVHGDTAAAEQLVNLAKNATLALQHIWGATQFWREEIGDSPEFVEQREQLRNMLREIAKKWNMWPIIYYVPQHGQATVKSMVKDLKLGEAAMLRHKSKTKPFGYDELTRQIYFLLVLEIPSLRRNGATDIPPIEEVDKLAEWMSDYFIHQRELTPAGLALFTKSGVEKLKKRKQKRGKPKVAASRAKLKFNNPGIITPAEISLNASLSNTNPTQAMLTEKIKNILRKRVSPLSP